MGHAKFTPQSQYLTSINQLLLWNPGSLPFDQINIAQISMRTRPPLAENTPLLQDCNDFKGGYVSNGDLYPQGTSDPNTYAFCYWQYMDSFIYFTHHRIGIPTTWWTNACHVNGVAALGNIMFEPNNGTQAEMDALFNPNGNGSSILIQIAKYYGFDGWFFNMENGQPSGGANWVNTMMSTVRSAGLLSEYYTAYVHNVNSNNVQYLVNSDGYFVDYGWSASDVSNSIQTALSKDCSPNTIYMGDDCWNRNTTTQSLSYIPTTMGKLGTAVTTAYSGNYASCGLFAPGWTFECVGNNDFDTYAPIDAMFWTGAGAPAGQKSVSSYIAARLQPKSLPFGTNFDRGRGTMMAVRGQTISGVTGWSNLALQGQQPIYPFKSTSGNPAKFTPSLIQTTAYDGGACLQVLGLGAAATDSVTYALFDFAAPISGPVTVTVIFKPLAAVYPNVTATLVAHDGTTAMTTATPTQNAGWYTLSQSLSQISGKTLASLQLTVGGAVGGAPAGNYGVQIGLVSVTPNAGQATPGAVGNLQGWVAAVGGNGSQAFLTWTAPAVPARYYDIWQMGGSSPQWLVRVCANAAWLSGITATGSVTFGVQPVGFDLATPGPMATVSLDFGSMSFDDTNLAAMLGSVVTGLQIWSGDVLNAVQTINTNPLTASNASDSNAPTAIWTLPQHGGSSGMQNPPVTLASGETITSITGFTGTWYGWTCVLQATFHSSTGKTYGPYGSMANATSSTPFTLSGSGSLRALSGTLVNVPLAGGNHTNIIASLSATFN